LNRPYWSQQSYRHILERFWGIYQPLEALLATVDWASCGIKFSERRKADWLLADLAYFEMPAESIESLDVCGTLPRFDDLAAGLGALYVLEGATLGGQVMLRDIGAQIGLSREAGGRFFTSYGSEIGAMWRSYLAVLEEQAGRPDAEAAITRSAVETFSAFERWFAAIGTGTRFGEPTRSTHV
jgi:heme oxygenase